MRLPVDGEFCPALTVEWRRESADKVVIGAPAGALDGCHFGASRAFAPLPYLFPQQSGTGVRTRNPGCPGRHWLVIGAAAPPATRVAGMSSSAHARARDGCAPHGSGRPPARMPDFPSSFWGSMPSTHRGGFAQNSIAVRLARRPNCGAIARSQPADPRTGVRARIRTRVPGPLHGHLSAGATSRVRGNELQRDFYDRRQDRRHGTRG